MQVDDPVCLYDGEGFHVAAAADCVRHHIAVSGHSKLANECAVGFEMKDLISLTQARHPLLGAMDEKEFVVNGRKLSVRVNAICLKSTSAVEWTRKRFSPEPLSVG